MAGLRLALLVLCCTSGAVAWAQSSTTFSTRDCPTCPEMVSIRGGTFMMGAGPGEEERENVPPQLRGRAQPQRQVTVPAFLMGQFEVTRDQFSDYVKAAKPRLETGCWSEGSDGKRYQYKTFTWRKPGFPQNDGREPVVCVNYVEARGYANWLSKVTGKRYRLPSEAEWEYAARGGTTGPRPFAADRGSFCSRANVGDLSLADAYRHRRDRDRYGTCSDGYPFTAPVGQFPANKFGLYDMLGNVWEWTEDCWHPSYEGAPTDHKPRTQGDCEKRVVRGGGWFNEPWRATTTFRFRDSTGHNGNMLGFRLARDP